MGNGYPVGRKSRLSAQVSLRKKHDCANSSNQQNYSGTSLGDGRYRFVLTSVFVFLCPSLPVVIALVAFSAIVVGIRQRRKNKVAATKAHALLKLL